MPEFAAGPELLLLLYMADCTNNRVKVFDTIQALIYVAGIGEAKGFRVGQLGTPFRVVLYA